MKLLFRCLLTVFALAAVQIATALPITPSSGTLGLTRWQGPESSQSAINDIIDDIIGIPLTNFEMYKQDVGLPEAPWPLAGSYDTTFANTPGDPSEFTIEYKGGPFIAPTAYLLVKGGGPSSAAPLWYLYNLTGLGWNGTDTVAGSGFWPDQGAVSHVSLYGGIRVPDGAHTLLLVGVAVWVFSLLRRRR